LRPVLGEVDRYGDPLTMSPPTVGVDDLLLELQHLSEVELPEPELCRPVQSEGTGVEAGAENYHLSTSAPTGVKDEIVEEASAYGDPCH